MSRFLVVVVIAVLGSVSPSQATISAVGKTISSVASSDGVPVTIPAVPFDHLSVAVPKRYRSEKDFLTITVSYQVACYEDTLYGGIDIGGVGAEPDLPGGGMIEREGADHNPIVFVTRQWFVAPSSLGGPSIPSDAIVTHKLQGDVGNGCTISVGSMVVEIRR